jgi:hypothetical protein
MTINVTSWLPNLLGPVEFLINGVLQSVPKRLRINIIGSVTVADNPGADRTDITISGGGGGGSPGGSADEIQVNDGAGGFAGATNVKAGSGYVSVGATPATTGGVRLANQTYIKGRDVGNSVDFNLVGVDNSDTPIFGDASTNPKLYGAGPVVEGTTSVVINAPTISAYPQSGQWYVFNTNGSGYLIYADAVAIQIGRPVISDGTAARGSIDGRAAHDFTTDADETLTGVEYRCSYVAITDSGTVLTTTRVLNFPTPADDLNSYRRYVGNYTGQTITLDCTSGAGSTVNISSGAFGVYWFTPVGVAGPF